METYETLEKEFGRKIKELQRRCKHKKIKWMDEWWAIGHSTGRKVKVCLICNKRLKWKNASIVKKRDLTK